MTVENYRRDRVSKIDEFTGTVITGIYEVLTKVKSIIPVILSPPQAGHTKAGETILLT